MKNLRKLGAAIVLTSVLAAAAFAGETHTPPCAATDPGETHAPPCVEQPTPDDISAPTAASTAPGEMGTTFTEIAADIILTFLPLF